MVSLFVSVFAALFSVANPLAAMPVFLAMTKDETTLERNRIALHTAVYFIVIMTFFFMLGTAILAFFGISINAMRIAGGLIILGSGYALMSGRFAKSRTVNKKVQQEAMEKEDISLTPLAVPLIGGPGSISLLISLFAEQDEMAEYGIILSVILAVGLTTYLILRLSPRLFRFLGTAGLNSISRILGFLVMAIGVQYLIVGITAVVSMV